jgi:NTF2 fold immunity protein
MEKKQNSISFKDQTLSADDLKQLIENVNIKTVTFENCPITDADLLEIAKMPKLYMLLLNGTHRLTFEGLLAMASLNKTVYPCCHDNLFSLVQMDAFIAAQVHAFRNKKTLDPIEENKAKQRLLDFFADTQALSEYFFSDKCMRQWDELTKQKLIEIDTKHLTFTKKQAYAMPPESRSIGSYDPREIIASEWITKNKINLYVRTNQHDFYRYLLAKVGEDWKIGEYYIRSVSTGWVRGYF